MPNQPIDPPGLFKEAGFHQVMVSEGSRMIHIAGQGAYDSDMNVVGENHKEQMLQALKNTALALKAAGASPVDIVSSTIYVKGLKPSVAQGVMEALAQAVDGQPYPAHAFNMIGIETLADPRHLVEVTSLAVL